MKNVVLLLGLITSLNLCLIPLANAEIRLWLTASTTNGDLGGRTGANAFCQADQNLPQTPNSTTIAFLSVTSSDEIRDIPANYNIDINEQILRLGGNIQIVPNFNSLITGPNPLINSISRRRTTTYTGSLPDGSLAPNASNSGNCGSFTSSSFTMFSQGGATHRTDRIYLSGFMLACNVSAHLYCLTFTPPAPVIPNPDDDVCFPIKAKNGLSVICI